MQKVRDFLTLRPIFSGRGLRILWIVFLVGELVPAGYYAYGAAFDTHPGWSLSSWLIAAPYLLRLIATILMGRVVLELALVFLDLKPEWRRPRIS
ncbi:MAG TPA: hypothetical protein VHA70_09210 [Bauldia sp.]|nr:hypothetical protein [Bauldia sp.]